MYEKPTLTRFGSFREVTRGGDFPGFFDVQADNWLEFLFTDTPTAS